jgi:hypothetical protein
VARAPPDGAARATAWAYIAFATVGPFDPDRDPRGRYPAGSGKRPRPWPRPVAGALPAEDVASNSRNEFSNHLQDAPLSSGITLSFQHVWARTSPQAQGSAQGHRHTHADPCRGQGQCTLVARFHP